jgi:hypothetical protein
VNDEWQTTREAWAELAPLLERWKSRRVWQPFYYDGECAAHLRSLGFQHVLHEDEDFFPRASDPIFLAGVDLIVDNPPYTSAETKDRVLRALVGSGKPFCCLFPVSVLFTTLFREAFAGRDVQLVLPRRLKVCKTGGPPVPFKQMVWLCLGCELERDLSFIGE